MASIRKLHGAVITLDDGSTVQVERIGRGRYTTAWRDGHHVYLQTKDGEYSKDILAALSGTRHIPTTEELGWGDDDAPWRLYRQPLYRRLTKRDFPNAYRQWKSLAEAREAAFKDVRGPNWRGHDLNARTLEIAQASPNVDESVRETLQALIDKACDYGHNYCMEFNQGNMAVHPERDELILLDPLFDLDEVRASQMATLKKHRGY